MAASETSRRERFEALFAAHYRDVYRYALRRTKPALAEEVANEAFLVAWRRLDRVPEHALPWLYAAAGNVLAHQRRAERAGPRSRRARCRARRRPARLHRARRARPRGAAPDRLGAPHPRRRSAGRRRHPPRLRDARPPRAPPARRRAARAGRLDRPRPRSGARRCLTP